MGSMNIRSSYAFDRDTALTIRTLADRWKTSQAEAIHRAVRQAADPAAAEVVPMTPAEVIAHYRQNPPERSWDETQKLIEQSHRLRAADDARRLKKRKPAA